MGKVVGRGGGGGGGDVPVCACVCACACACVHCACVCVCVCVCMACSPVCVHGVREQLRKMDEKKGKLTWKKDPTMDSYL